MIVRVIDVFVKKERVEEFIRATVANHQGSIREPGCLRFDILQSEPEPVRFFLYEVYRDERAAQEHKETSHYNTWKQEVEAMMDRPRQGNSCKVIAPTDPGEW